MIVTLFFTIIFFESSSLSPPTIITLLFPQENLMESDFTCLIVSVFLVPLTQNIIKTANAIVFYISYLFFIVSIFPLFEF